VQTGPLIFIAGPYSTRRSVSPSRIHLAIENAAWPPVRIFSLSEQDCKGEFFRNRRYCTVRYGTVRWRAGSVSSKNQVRFLLLEERDASASTELRVLRQGPASGFDEAMICSFECTFCRGCAIGVLQGVCPNCGGRTGQTPDPAAGQARQDPASSERVLETRRLPARSLASALGYLRRLIAAYTVS